MQQELFKFIDPNANDKISKMKGLDLQELLVLIDDYYLELREKLGFDRSVTFGFELEFEDAIKRRIERRLNATFPESDWIMKNDASLDNGAEINSPILRDNRESWKELDEVCNIVEPLASIGNNAGGHVHIGAQALGNKEEAWLNFIKLWSIYENIIFRFAYGEFLTARPNIEKYAKPMAIIFYRFYNELKREEADIHEIVHRLSYDRYFAVNFQNTSGYVCNGFDVENTIEFRCPNGTLNSAIWQNNANLFANLLLYSKSNNYDDDKISERHRINNNKYSSLKWYDEIYLEQALEFSDLLFNNNLDKIYFLKQYLKSFETRNMTSEYPKAQVFTKKK